MQKNNLLTVLFISCSTITMYGQSSANNPLSYVNPFIGTAKSDAPTRWGNEGGTYPGAVAPWGYLQLTPETAGGYDYRDSSICYFSCIGHMSGYPAGSAGKIRIMPVGSIGSVGSVGSGGTKYGGGKAFSLNEYRRPFLHAEENAQPGYYAVRFRDDNTLVEATTAQRAGMYRFTFPAGVVPKIFIEGKLARRSLREWEGLAMVLRCSESITGEEKARGGRLLCFAPSAVKPRVILLRLSVSPAGIASAKRNIAVELGNLDFDQLRTKTANDWRKELGVISIDDNQEEKKRIFYTALYHSMLVPWIISDVDGNYKGRDGLIHKAPGKNEYGGFSPWDTFRSLHPLLCLLFPERQKDMVLSMMDVYRQTGHLPADPMTGDHAIPILVDTYLKGIRGFDVSTAYTAMKKDLAKGPFANPDRAVYRRLGYLPSSYPESVTRTVEYAYDDWAFAAFSALAMHREEGDGSEQRSYNYRNLLDPATLFLLPRRDDQAGPQFSLGPGNAGYKEGDKWVYSYFAPQHPEDLVNLMGGKKEFAERLDSALRAGLILFDNETVFHIPYLFNYALRPDLTRHWVGKIMSERFAATPGGLPGNDDLGSMSSWYVFSALGIYPLCPGRPVYDIGTPSFRSVTLHLAGGKQFIIKTGNVSSLLVNKTSYPLRPLPHSLILKGGEIIFGTGTDPAYKAYQGEADSSEKGPEYTFSGLAVTKDKLTPNELAWIRFSVRNSGATGVKIVRLRVNDREYGHKNCLVPERKAITDSIPFRLYAFGKTRLEMEGVPALEVEVVKGEEDRGNAFEVSNLSVKPIFRVGEQPSVVYDVRNTWGDRRKFFIPLLVDDSIVRQDSLLLEPGESREISGGLPLMKEGLHTVCVKDTKAFFKVYSKGDGSVVLDLALDRVAGDSLVEDGSGFGNLARIVRTVKKGVGKAGDKGAGDLSFGKNCYLEVSNSSSLDRMGETITMMAWVYQTQKGAGLVDLFTKGDNHVLQIAGNRRLSFFAGGWGRGDCTVDLPADWIGKWHHIAGVCNGMMLQLYIDGKLAGQQSVDGRVNLSVTSKWTFGRNEEFPGQRIFTGYMDKMKVFTEPLNKGEIISIMNRDRPAYHFPH